MTYIRTLEYTSETEIKMCACLPNDLVVILDSHVTLYDMNQENVFKKFNFEDVKCIASYDKLFAIGCVNEV